jgi:hypothetical protein
LTIVSNGNQSLTMETQRTHGPPTSVFDQEAAALDSPDRGGAEDGARSGARPRMVSVRLDVERYDALATLAAREGLAPTAMARMLLHRAIRETERETQYLP